MSLGAKLAHGPAVFSVFYFHRIQSKFWFQLSCIGTLYVSIPPMGCKTFLAKYVWPLVQMNGTVWSVFELFGTMIRRSDSSSSAAAAR
jgi:hypothetical protein